MASRIESISVPGVVTISDKVFDEIKNQNDITTVSLGIFNLKNVKRQIEIYAITNEGLVVPTEAQIGVKLGSEKKVLLYCHLLI